MDEGNVRAIAEICVRLDGLPLAIELAAARMRVLPPRALLSRLGRRLVVLDSGPQDQPERQRTLRAALDWSYELLSPAEQALFRRLSVFVGGFALVAVAEVCDPDSSLGTDPVRGVGLAVGMGLSFFSATVAATSGVANHQQGVASGLINTSSQVGSALGLAVLISIGARASALVAASGETDPSVALLVAFRTAHAFGALFAAIATLVATVAVRPELSSD
jgi:hypothetical protein